MNIKDSYLHGGTHVIKNIQFSIAASGTHQNKLVATITWAEEGSSDTELAIPISGATFGSQTKNTVFAAPNGSAGVPSFRALDAADIPNLGAGKITSGEFAAARLPLATNSAKGAVILGVAKTSDADTAITGKKYWVKMNTNGKLFVDIPWNDNTHYTAVPILGGSTATSNATSDTANNATYLNIIENSTKSGGIQIIGSGATTVKANGGVLTINSTNSTYTGYNIVFQNNAGTTVDTYKALTSPSKTIKAGSNITISAASNVITIQGTANTWKAANSTQEGYVPQLASGGTALADSTNDYILAFTYADSGTLTPSWKKLPANAYLNNTYTVNNGTYSIKSKIGSTTTTLSDFTANQSGTDDFTLIQGNNITFTNDTTNRTLTIAGTPNTTYTLKIGTSASASDVVTLLSGTSTTSGTIITNTAYNASNNKIATMTDVNNAVTSMFKFQNNTDALPTGTQKTGYAYRVNTTFTLAAANSASGAAETLEPGDLIICTDATTPKYLALNTNWTVTNSAPTLGTTAKTIATIGGVAITASLPTASRSGSTVTAGIITPTSSGTEKFLREDGTWVKPSYISNTDRTGVKLATVNGTKKTDSTVIIANSSTGLSIAGGTNRFSIGDGTNYIEVEITPSITNNVTGSGTSGKLVKWSGANTITDGPALSSSISSQSQTTKFLREDGTWAAPSYTTDTVRPIYSGGTSRFTSSQKTAINFVGAGATSVLYEAAGTGEGKSGNANYANIKISSNNDLVKFSAITAGTEYYLPVRVKNTTDTAQQLYRTSIIVKDSTITATLSGNASTATNLSKTSGTNRGYLYQSANTTTACTGVGSVTAAADIGIPYIGYASSANTYGIYKDLFYLSGTTKYIGNNVHSNKFACVKTKDSVTDDWTGSSTSGSQSGSGTNTYTAGTGININNGVISTTRNEWYGTEAQFDNLASLDANTTYYITAN